MSGSTKEQMYQEIIAGGYFLVPSQSATFTYPGQIVIGQQLQGLGRQMTTQLIIPGQNYQVNSTGSGLVSQAGTVATSIS